MSDEPGFGPETHGTYEPTAEEVAARARRQVDDSFCSLNDVRVGQPKAPYHAACKCGWWGPYREKVRDAIKDAREHAGVSS